MYNSMNGVNVADKLGLGPEVRELKFGSSFTSGSRGQQQGSFHSVRYDFKPASVDTSKTASLDVGPNGQVTISMPNVDGNGTTVFKGARKPYAKECVLIIDNDTGEVVLEKLTHNIQVKRTREEGGSKKASTMSMPVAPPPPAEVKKSHPNTSFKGDPKFSSREDPKKLMPSTSSQMQHQHPLAQNSKRASGKSPLPPNHQRKSPSSGPSPGHTASPPLGFSPSVAQDSHRSSKHSQPQPQQQQQQHNLFSLTNFEDLLSMPQPQMNPPATQKVHIPEKSSQKESGPSHTSTAPMKLGAGSGNGKNTAAAAASALSESSSGDDSSSISSSDEDSSDMEEVIEKVPIPPAPDSNRSPSLANRARPPPPQPVAPSMPTDLLCEDLQLSESGSDSD